MSGTKREAEGVPMSSLEGDIALKLNAFEYQGLYDLRTGVQIIRHARTHSVGKCQSCMF